MYKIGVIGDYDTVCGFAALGLDTFSVTSEQEAENTLKSLVENNYGIIYITEEYMEKSEKICNKFKELKTPAIIPIPQSKGTTGYGIGRVKKYVEQAVGSDIIFNND